MNVLKFIILLTLLMCGGVILTGLLIVLPGGAFLVVGTFFILTLLGVYIIYRIFH